MKRRLLALFRLRKSEYFADFLITPPLTLGLLLISAWHGLSPGWFLQFAIGVFAWTLYEYVTHRWLLHRAWLFRDLHALHHADQTDYIAVHPLVTLILYGGFWLAFGFRSSALTVGFSVGYVVYSALHTAFHYAHIGERSYLFALKRHHALHHKFEDNNFGVSTALWDRIFRTCRS